MRAHHTTTVKPPTLATPTFTPVRSGLLQRECACGGKAGSGGECEECHQKKLQRKAWNSELGTQNGSSVPPIVHDVLRSPGQPLDSAARAFMEPRFGHDFGHVRVHTDSKAAESSRAVGALAYTFGSEMVFASGQYEPRTFAGQLLIAHELTHIVQQGNRKQTAPTELSSPDDPQELEASAVSARALTDPRRNSEAPIAGSESDTIQAGWPIIVAAGVGLAGAIYAIWAYRCLKPLEASMYTATFGDPARTGGFRLWYYNQTHVPVPSNVWDAFGHCWIGCASTQRCGSVTAAIAGKSREFWREYIDSDPHDSYTQDTANQTIGRGFGSGGGDCTTSCRNAALSGALDLSAPRATFWDPLRGDFAQLVPGQAPFNSNDAGSVAPTALASAQTLPDSTNFAANGVENTALDEPQEIA
ncbi:MAG TPA: DUF4157 domain-containing protein [Verrucomicrobiae bacterium]|nr:DUF4157 domain-containing protein [Verrucomicrobiae bacterium]